jgi:hypothetical protein
VAPQRVFKKIERTVEADFIARVFDAEAGMPDRRAVAAEGFAEMCIIQAEADMGEIDRHLPRASDSLGFRPAAKFALRNRQGGGGRGRRVQCVSASAARCPGQGRDCIA